MSLVKIIGDEPVTVYQAVQVGTRRDGPFDDPFWLVYLNGPDKQGAPYEDYEVERVPAHRGEYEDWHWGEQNPNVYNGAWASQHRKEGEAN